MLTWDERALETGEICADNWFLSGWDTMIYHHA
jgi:hypothetical protein